jgi:hypothetical protein
MKVIRFDEKERLLNPKDLDELLRTLAEKLQSMLGTDLNITYIVHANSIVVGVCTDGQDDSYYKSNFLLSACKSSKPQCYDNAKIVLNVGMCIETILGNKARHLSDLARCIMVAHDNVSNVCNKFLREN